MRLGMVPLDAGEILHILVVGGLRMVVLIIFYTKNNEKHIKYEQQLKNLRMSRQVCYHDHCFVIVTIF